MSVLFADAQNCVVVRGKSIGDGMTSGRYGVSSWKEADQVRLEAVSSSNRSASRSICNAVQLA